MAVDIQVCFPQQVVPLNSVRILPGFNPRSLDIMGTDFTSIDEVKINDIVAPEVVVLSKTRMLVQVPIGLRNSALSSVTVTSTKLTVSSRSLIKFKLGRTPSKVSGILRLVQLFLKILLTTTGIDIFSPRIGGNGLKDIGLTFGKDQGGTIVSDIIISTSTTQRQIIAIQSRDPSIPRDERLLAATVTTADYNTDEGALVVSIELVSHAGKTATANLMV